MLRVDLQLDIDTSQSSRLRRRTRSMVEIFQDPAVIAVLLLAVGALGFALYLNQQANEQYRSLQQEVRQALRDSTSLQSDLAQAEELKARRTEIRERIQRVQQIDQGRYAYVHVMDQVSAALPAETWIESLQTQSHKPESGQITFTVTGFAATNDIVSQFINRLENSAFIQNVSFQSSSQVPMGIQQITEFTLRGRSTQPDLSFLETIRIMPDGQRVESPAPPAGRAPGRVQEGQPSEDGDRQQREGQEGKTSIRMRMDTATQADTSAPDTTPQRPDRPSGEPADSAAADTTATEADTTEEQQGSNVSSSNSN